MLVSKKRFTFTPLPVSISESLIKSILGETPAVKPTTSQIQFLHQFQLLTIDFTFPFSSDLISFKLTP